GSGVFPVLAQAPAGEMKGKGRTAEDVVDAATWGVLQEGFRDGFGADADHLREPEDIDAAVAAGFTMFTIDAGPYIDDSADGMSDKELEARYAHLDFEVLRASAGALLAVYEGRAFRLADGSRIAFEEDAFLLAAVKFGRAIAQTVKMYRHLAATSRGEFEVEVTMDEASSPTSPAEHFFFAEELRRLGVKFVSLAPRLTGGFEKGVDYIGDVDAFRRSFAEHVAVMKTLGPYKISIHSGADKFSIYPVIAELAGGMVHVKTGGASYLEAVRVVARADPALFREILDFSRRRYEKCSASRKVSADVSKVPAAKALRDDDLPYLLDQSDARQVLHVTSDMVLGAKRLRKRMLKTLNGAEEMHYAALAEYFGRHVAPFAR
ncbi:MAG: tagaturonate epimerase family protein, partial [Planctomycetia bacterium]|nr:tagaturonate epimerase family protein [Planctomycetia bacterium]